MHGFSERRERKCSGGGKMTLCKGLITISPSSLMLSVHIQLPLDCILEANDLVCCCMAATGDICNGPQAIVSYSSRKVAQVQVGASFYPCDIYIYFFFQPPSPSLKDCGAHIRAAFARRKKKNQNAQRAVSVFVCVNL